MVQSTMIIIKLVFGCIFPRNIQVYSIFPMSIFRTIHNLNLEQREAAKNLIFFKSILHRIEIKRSVTVMVDIWICHNLKLSELTLLLKILTLHFRIYSSLGQGKASSLLLFFPVQFDEKSSNFNFKLTCDVPVNFLCLLSTIMDNIF